MFIKLETAALFSTAFHINVTILLHIKRSFPITPSGLSKKVMSISLEFSTPSKTYSKAIKQFTKRKVYRFTLTPLREYVVSNTLM